MFTGIVQGRMPVKAVDSKPDFSTLTIQMDPSLMEGLKTGASIAVNGVCLTVTAFDEGQVSFDVMKETLRVTNLVDVRPGTFVNVERAARFSDEIGGHLLSGHVHDTVVVKDVIREPENTTILFTADPRWRDYLMPKGYVALNGASLTLGETVTDDEFRVHLIPETLRLTTFATVEPGDKVNLEIDSQTQAVVNTVKRCLGDQGFIQRLLSK